MVAAGAAVAVLLLLIVVIATASGGDEEPETNPADLGVPTIQERPSDSTETERTETEETDTETTPAAPVTPPVDGAAAARWCRHLRPPVTAGARARHP